MVNLFHDCKIEKYNETINLYVPLELMQHLFLYKINKINKSTDKKKLFINQQNIIQLQHIVSTHFLKKKLENNKLVVPFILEEYSQHKYNSTDYTTNIPNHIELYEKLQQQIEKSIIQQFSCFTDGKTETNTQQNNTQQNNTHKKQHKIIVNMLNQIYNTEPTRNKEKYNINTDNNNNNNNNWNCFPYNYDDIITFFITIELFDKTTSEVFTQIIKTNIILNK